MSTPNLFSLEGKKIAFSGATGVLGKTMALHLAAAGAELLILGRTPEKVNELVAEVTAAGGKASAYIADVTDEESLSKIAREIEIQHGRVDILINSAGGNMPGAVVRPDQNFLDLDT